MIPVRDLLDGMVGTLASIEVGPVDGATLAWAGVDATGSLRSGTMRLRVDVDDAKAITLACDVEVDEP